MRTFVIGDIHGRHDKLVACLKLVNFDYDNDQLIQLGDVVDRGIDSYECVEELLKIKNLIPIQGNHDSCFWDSIRTGNNNVLFMQGGKKTLESYIKNCNPDKEIVLKFSGYYTDFEYDDFPISHINFYKNQLPYYIDSDNNLFIHGGFHRHHPIAEQDRQDFIWDRDLWLAAMSHDKMANKEEHPFKTKDNFKEIFIGHTPTPYFGSDLPLHAANIWNLDTGCGKSLEAKLTIMELSTKQYWQA